MSPTAREMIRFGIPLDKVRRSCGLPMKIIKELAQEIKDQEAQKRLESAQNAGAKRAKLSIDGLQTHSA